MALNGTQTAVRAGHPRRWAILALVLAAECMDLLDGTIVTSRRRRAGDLHARRRRCNGSSAATRWRSPSA